MKRAGSFAAAVLCAVAGLVLLVPYAFAGTTELISIGELVEGSGGVPTISADGRYVAFPSATDLLAIDTNGFIDIYVHDRATGQLELITVSTGENRGSRGPTAISPDGRYVVFLSSIGYAYEIFLHDRVTGVSEKIDVNDAGEPANGESSIANYLSISDDGRYVVFDSTATNLVSGDNNGAPDTFVRDRVAGTTRRVNVASDGTEGNGRSMDPSMSGDGRYVVFSSYADNLVAGDTNGLADVFMHDTVTGETRLVSVSLSGVQGNGWSGRPSVSGDGRYVAFESYSTVFDARTADSYPDIFLYDRLAGGVTELISVSPSGEEGNSSSQGPIISADGMHVAYQSYASNLVPLDRNGTNCDVFVHDRGTGTNEVISISSAGEQAPLQATGAGISGDGTIVGFQSPSEVFDPRDQDTYVWDTFIHDRTADADGDTFAGIDDCNDYDTSIFPGAGETKHDGIDQDCNGYDLTIDITAVDYKSNKDRLSVTAYSSYESAAALVLENYGPMSWKNNRWEITVEPAGGDPGTVTVSGTEGFETAPTN